MTAAEAEAALKKAMEVKTIATSNLEEKRAVLDNAKATFDEAAALHSAIVKRLVDLGIIQANNDTSNVIALLPELLVSAGLMAIIPMMKGGKKNNQ